ncbi:MAG: TolC family protein [Deltaproteobacteria bacterium]|nr:TolC family protein [Deltaproteobacteria bacterium]
MLGRIVTALALALLLGSTAHAQDPDPSDPTTAAPATLHGALRLSIEDAIAMGLKNNLNVEVSRHDPLASWEEFRSAWGAYDPQMFAEFGYESRETPVASSLQTNPRFQEREVGGRSGVQGKIPWLNATYGVVYDGMQETTNSTIQDLSPSNNVSLAAEASVPLLKNLIWDRDWTRVKQTEILYDISGEEFRRQVMDTVQTMENFYWNLVATEDAVRVAEKSLETAEALLRQTKRGQPDPHAQPLPADPGPADERGAGPRPAAGLAPGDRALHAAGRLHHLPDRRGGGDAQGLREPARAGQRLRRDRAPQARALVPQEPEAAAAGPQGPLLAPGHLRWFSRQKADSWSAMGVLSFPIGNRAAGHQANKAEIELRKAASQVARLRQGIILEVRDAARNLESAQEGIEAAERQRIASQEQLRAERIRLEQGESTPFDVLLRERDLVDAEVNKIDALRVYRNSVVDLDRRQGTILRTRNILIDDVRGAR